MSNTGVCSSTAVLDISSNKTTTWYLPLFNYTGSLYISQVDLSGSLIGSGVWSNVSATQLYTTNYYTYAYSDKMDVSYNSTATGYGFMFTGVNLPNYSLYVTFMGVIQRAYSFTFTSTNPYDPNTSSIMTNNRYSWLNMPGDS